MRILAALAVALTVGPCLADTTQQRVHDMSHGVMPFDMSKTLHVFVMTDQGGIQKVITRKDGDSAQVALIRQHLQHEAEAFRKGNYGDPASLHGEGMPGLADVKTRAAEITVRYSELQNGAEIVFSTNDLQTITAIHRWFGAQLSEHGADAISE